MSQQLQAPQQAKLHLDWLFVAFFANGYTIQQTHDDKCLTRDDGTGSAFTDVRERNERDHDLVAFELRHIDGDKAVMVDLKTGAFMANGIPMHLHNQNFDPTKYDLKLIYFRETRVDQNVKATILDDMSVSQKQIGDLHHYVNRYFIGWETEVNGKKKQQTLAVG